MTPSTAATNAWISITSSTRVISVLTTDATLHGTTETFTVTSTLNNSSASTNSQYVFSVTLNNPCLMTAPASPADYTYKIDTPAYTWTVPAFNSNSLCTATTTLSVSPTRTWLTLNSSARTLTVSSTDLALAGTSVAFTLTATQNNASASTNSGYTFTIIFSNPCVLTATTSPSSYTYYIDNGAYSWTVPAFIPASGCTYTETLTLSPTPASLSTFGISISGRTITILNTNAAMHGTTQLFTLTSTLNDTNQ